MVFHYSIIWTENKIILCLLLDCHDSTVMFVLVAFLLHEEQGLHNVWLARLCNFVHFQFYTLTMILLIESIKF